MITVHGPNLSMGGEDFHVHAKGCFDLRRYHGAGRDYHPADYPDGTTLLEIAEDTYADQLEESPDDSAEDYVSDFRVFDCAHKLIGR